MFLSLHGHNTVLVYEGELPVSYIVRRQGDTNNLLEMLHAGMFHKLHTLIALFASREEYSVKDGEARKLLRRLPLHGIPVLTRDAACTDCETILVNTCRGIPLPSNIENMVKVFENGGCVSMHEPLVIEPMHNYRLVIFPYDLDKGIEALGVAGVGPHTVQHIVL